MAGAVIDDSVGHARDGEPRANPRFAVFLLILFTCYNTLDSADRTVLSGSFQSVGAFLRDDLHTTATDAAFGSLTSAFIVGFSVSAVIVGQVAGRWPHLNLVIVAVCRRVAEATRHKYDWRPRLPLHRPLASCGPSVSSCAQLPAALVRCWPVGPCRASARCAAPSSSLLVCLLTRSSLRSLCRPLG